MSLRFPRWLNMWLLPGLALLGLAGLVACATTRSSATTPAVGSLAVPPTGPSEFILPTAPPTWDRHAFNTMVAAVMTALPTASPFPGWPPEKAFRDQYTDAYIRAASTIAAQYPIPVEPLPTITPGPHPNVSFPTQVAGAGIIVPVGCGMEYKAWVRSSSRWSELVNNRVVVVCAGSSPHLGLHNQGAIMVETTDTEGAVIGGPDTYNTPTQAGAVQVIDAVGERLTLKAKDGTLLYFDVPSRRWVNP